jgi:hypothetical protein
MTSQVETALPRTVAWAIGAHALLATALFVSDGHDHAFAVLLVLASVGAVGVALVATVRAPSVTWRGTLPLTWAVALASTLLAFVRPPGDFAPTDGRYMAMSFLAVGLVASYAPSLRLGLSPAGWVARARVVGIFGVALGLGAWMLHASPSPDIDVWPIHQQGADALLHGRSAYAPGVIAAMDTHSYARVIETYMYPPMNLVLTTVAFALTGDTRWAVLVAILTASLQLLFVARKACGPRSVWPDLLAATLLFHPRGLFVLEHAWGDPLALPFLGGFVLACAARRYTLAAVLLGLLAATKQQLVLFLPILAFVPGVGVRGVLIAMLVLVGTYVPFAIVSAREMWHALVLHHLHNPFRSDSLSLTALVSRTGLVLPSWVGIGATLATLLVVRRLPRTLGAMLLTSALCFLVFYVLGRQAFCNYYYPVCAVILFAAATLEGAPVGSAVVSARPKA